MWKLPFNVLGAEAYSEIIFSNSEECEKKFGEAIHKASTQVAKRKMTVGKFLIFKHQVIALPPAHFDQRLLGIADVSGWTFDINRPKEIKFED